MCHAKWHKQPQTADSAVWQQAGREARHRALIAALEDMEGWLATCALLFNPAGCGCCE